MTLDRTIDALIFLQAEMRRRKLRTDIECGFYADSPREVVHLTLVDYDVERMMADPSRFVTDDQQLVGIPLQDAIQGERK